ncbi:ABC transporter ATP-binding protein [Marinilabilia rubra]|uniref:ABC transporter ATP-binding protein n=1 Tax=Marinilabilia rubra TaxID=2162893 RepID=A0A2U2B3W4_9BACT|nr:ABC transporter ATP-binding protein [Marinilabilia rubra]PWD97753.1 ABC transporter ATP-binding protein [Marinilabilia rubra]
MSDTVIKIENLSKIYRLGEIGTGTLSHDLNRWWQMNIRGKDDPYALVGGVNDRTAKARKGEHIAALKDINLEVKQGEVLGIIGKNGAGKSTLLKVLSRVTSPTTGSISVKGRLASLLEVGTGFHPEMTGRENIYMNGTIMGMRKWEITRKLEEIVEFAGVAKYLDTPVKRYSSGMKVRLGFAVAAHLEPEILVVDEVLAVGDAEFQKKAIGKMQDVSTNDGRTVLFVSHNMASVKSLCTNGIILEDGFKVLETDIDACVTRYLKGNSDILNHKKWDQPEIKNSHFQLKEIGIKAVEKKYTEPISISEAIECNVGINFTNTNHSNFHVNLRFKNDQGNYLFVVSSNDAKQTIKPGSNNIKMKIPGNFFNTGNFYMDLMVVKDKKTVIFTENDILSFTLLNESNALGTWMGKTRGDLKPKFDWEITY